MSLHKLKGCNKEWLLFVYYLNFGLLSALLTCNIYEYTILRYIKNENSKKNKILLNIFTVIVIIMQIYTNIYSTNYYQDHIYIGVIITNLDLDVEEVRFQFSHSASTQCKISIFFYIWFSHYFYVILFIPNP